MNIYETIFKRKSIRKYDMKSLDLDILKDIERYLENIKPYDLDIKTKMYILKDEKEIEGMFKVKAPHYIAITSEKKEEYLLNAGYMLEQIVLYLASKGIGSCWLGNAKPIKQKLENSELDFVVMIAFGNPDETMYRENVAEFKRKNITEISNLTQTNNILEAAKLAPSAMNQQAWYFEFNQYEISVYRKKALIVIEKLSKIDIGIALAHIYIAFKEQGKNVEIIKKENKEKRGYEYILTCKII